LLKKESKSTGTIHPLKRARSIPNSTTMKEMLILPSRKLVSSSLILGSFNKELNVCSPPRNMKKHLIITRRLGKFESKLSVYLLLRDIRKLVISMLKAKTT